jgi:hypothetical protein
VRKGEFLDRAGRGAQATPRGTVRLRVYEDDLLSCGVQSREGADREDWRSGEG